MEYIIETKSLSKMFNNKYACNKINLHIKKGDIYGFIGKNGAGKTTTMKLILGLINPSFGEILINNSNDLNKERKKIGSLIEKPGFYSNLSAYENLLRYSIIFGGTKEEVKDILNLIGLADTGDKKAGHFSQGMKQRLGIGIALLGNPEILILDEPINGLDPSAIKDIRDLILKLNKERNVTFLISSHLLDELQKITTRYGIISNGMLVEEIDATDLTKRFTECIKIKVSDYTKAIHVLSKTLGITEVEIKENYLFVYSDLDKTALINKTLVDAMVDVSEIMLVKDNFENYFIERISRHEKIN